MEREKVFEARNVAMHFRINKKSLLSPKMELIALNEVSFDVFKGESLAIVGESGSGKSTLCKVAMRFYKPTKGELIYNGKNVHNLKGKQLKEYRQKAQMVFQDPFSSLNPLHSINYHLSRPLYLYHEIKDRTILQNKIKDILLGVGLVPPEEQGKKFPHQLSGGQKQRAFLGKMLAIGADLIFADEPTSMLDVSIRLGILNLMNTMKKELHKSFLYITHDIATARYVSDRIIVMYCGHMVEWGDINQVICEPKHPYTQLLIEAAPNSNKTDCMKPLNVRQGTEVPLWTPESKGCPFADRCVHALEKCKTYFPKAKEVSKGQFVRCNLF